MRMPRLTPWLVVVTLTAAGAAAAAGYGLTAPKRYTATAQLLVSPVPAADPTFAGLDLLRDAAGRHTAAESAAVLVGSPQVADAVLAQVGVRRSRAGLLSDLHTHVVGGSDVVDVEYRDASATSAAELANAFVDALIATRTTTFQSQLATAIRRDARLIAGSPAGPQTAELARRLAELRSLQGQPDPTVRRASTAIAPSSPSWPKVGALVLVGAAIGLGAGALVVLGAALLRRRPLDYSRGVPDASAEALLHRLEQRLAAREAALAARERDLRAKIDELRSLQRRPAQPAAADGLAAREAELVEREGALAERVRAVSRRELELARRAAAEKKKAAGAPAPARASAPVSVSVSGTEADPQPVPAPAPAAPEADAGTYNLSTLERLVDERIGGFPERADEWRSYLYFLRDYAAADGSLPASFDWLVLDTFRELVA